MTGGEQDPTAKRIDAYFLRNVHEEGNRAIKLISDGTTKKHSRPY